MALGDYKIGLDVHVTEIADGAALWGAVCFVSGCMALPSFNLDFTVNEGGKAAARVHCCEGHIEEVKSKLPDSGIAVHFGEEREHENPFVASPAKTIIPIEKGGKYLMVVDRSINEGEKSRMCSLVEEWLDSDRQVLFLGGNLTAVKVTRSGNDG